MLTTLQKPVDVVDLRPRSNTDRPGVGVVAGAIGALLIAVDNEHLRRRCAEPRLANLRPAVHDHREIQWELTCSVDLLLHPSLDLLKVGCGRSCASPWWCHGPP